MAAYYELLNSTTKWLIKKKIKPKTATKYSSELFLSLSKDAVLKKEIGFNKLVADSQTPGGLNMQVLKELKKGKFYDKFLAGTDARQAMREARLEMLEEVQWSSPYYWSAFVMVGRNS